MRWSAIRAFGNSGNGKLKRKTEIVKIKIAYFSNTPVKQDH